MELLRIARLPVEAVRFAGRQLLVGRWADLSSVLEDERSQPARASMQYFKTPDVPENVELGEE